MLLLRTLLFLLVSISFSSCTVFKLAEVKSVDDYEVEDDRYVFENDTLKIVYDFWDEDGAMRYAIENKTTKSISIDWSKSHLVYCGENLPYWTETQTVKTTGKTSSWAGAYGASIWGFGSFSSNSIINTPEKVTDLSPNAWIWRYDYRLLSITRSKLRKAYEALKSQVIPRRERKKIKDNILGDRLITSSNQNITFTEKDSPLTFTNILSLTFTDDNGKSEVVKVSHSFYIERLKSKKIAGVKKKVYKEKSGMRFYSLRDKRHLLDRNRKGSATAGSSSHLFTEIMFNKSR